MEVRGRGREGGREREGFWSYIIYSFRLPGSPSAYSYGLYNPFLGKILEKI
jgi:hypothetical protein